MIIQEKIPQAVAKATLQDVIERLQRDEGLSPVRKRDLISAVRRTAKLLGSMPTMIPVSIRALRERLEVVARPMTVSPRSMATQRSNLMAAIARSELVPVLRTSNIELSPPWRRTLDAADKTIWIGRSLSRFARYCSTRKIDPGAVTPEVAQAFAQSADGGSLRHGSAYTGDSVQRAWEALCANNPDLALPSLPKPDRPAKAGNVPWQDLSASFRDDVEQHLAWASGTDPFRPDTRDRPLSAGSLKLRRGYIHCAATALIRSGKPAADITSLSALVELDNFRQVLSQRFRQAGKQPTIFDQGLAKALRAIAREWAHIDDIAAAKLRVIAAKLPAIVGGLTPKNKRTLRQFDDPQGLRRLMALPAMLMKRAVLEPRGNRALADAQAAMAVAILLYCPIRIGNLVDLKVGETIRLAPNSRIRGTISLPAEVVKNNIDMEFGLPPAVNNIIRTYFEKVESRVLRSSTAFVFASLDGSRRQQTGLAMLVSRMIFRETGIK